MRAKQSMTLDVTWFSEMQDCSGSCGLALDGLSSQLLPCNVAGNGGGQVKGKAQRRGRWQEWADKSMLMKSRMEATPRPLRLESQACFAKRKQTP